MQLRYLELENIKSYGPRTRIDFTPGLNAVCGHNGSGKSTVLEAIGYALFDFLPYAQSAFLREGEKNGTVRLGLIGRDGREYEITRRVGGTYTLHDAETGDRIAERRPDVLAWIRERALDIDGDTDLAALFKNAVGVPQGLMTADFQGAASTRKTIFDPLLRVEEYRQANEELRDTDRFLRDRSAQVDTEIAALRTDTDRIGEREEEAARLRVRLDENGKRLRALEAEREQLLRQKGELDEAEARLVEVAGVVRDAEYQVTRLADSERHAQGLLDAAGEAQRIVAETEDAYHRVVEARRQIVRLEGLRVERDALKGELAAAQADRREHHGRIQSLDRQHREARESADAAAALVDAVAQQEELEGQLHEAQIRARDAARVEAARTKLAVETAKLRAAIVAREGKLAAARAAVAESHGITALQRELDEISGRLAAFGPLKEQRDALMADGKELKERRAKLLKAVADEKALRDRLAELQPLAAEFDALDLEGRSAQEGRVRVLAEIEYRESSGNDLRQSTCPLLHLTCPVVAQDNSMLDRFEERGVELQARAATLEASLATLQPRIARARDAQTQVQGLEIQLAGLGRPESDLTEVEEQLRARMQRFADLSAALEGENELRSRLRVLEGELNAVRARAQEAARLPLLEEQQSNDRDVLNAWEEELRHLDEERAHIRAAQDEVRALESRLRELRDPRKQQQHLLALAARRTAIERDLEAAHQLLLVASGRVKAIMGRLGTFETLDTDMQSQRAIESGHMGAHDRYLAHRDIAAAIGERRQAVEQVRKDLAAARVHLEAALRDQERRQGEYDAGRHARLREECDEAAKGIVRVQAEGTYLRSEMDKVDAELKRLLRLREKLRTQESERDELAQVARAVTFIRDTIKSAGPAVTETLLANISAGANDIFAEIMDDHAAELRWDRDYEVLVQRGPETRKFAQLSGGEQMSAALAVRLALLKEMSEVDFAFFDEPTQNMDGERRTNLADQIRQVRGFDQLIVISHDDTFEHHTDNLIRLQKVHEQTQVEGR